MKAQDLIIGGIAVAGVYLLVKSFQKKEEYPIVEYTLPASVPISDPTQATVMRWHPLMMTIGKNLQVEPAVLAAVIHRESAGMPEAIRYEPKKNDYSYGLMQVLSETARWLGFKAKSAYISHAINFYVTYTKLPCATRLLPCSTTKKSRQAKRLSSQRIQIDKLTRRTP